MRNPFAKSSQGGRVGRSLTAVALSAVALTSAVTGAYFTDSDAVGANTFATGDVDLTTNPTTNIASMPNMAPGDVRYGTVTVTNGGSLELRYALKSATTEDTLAAQLDLTVWDEAAEDDGTSPNATCSTTVPTTTLYTAAALGSVAGTQLFGNPLTGSQAGDRTLAAAVNEVLCLKVELPSTTGNAFETLTTSATFTFESEQTANNA